MAISNSVAAVGMIVIAVVAFVGGLFASPLVFPPVVGDPIWDGVVERGTIRIGSSPDWPPYEFPNETTGEFTGFEVELMNTIADRLNLDVEWIEMSFELIITEINKGTIDLGVSGFSVRPDRLEVIQYTMYHSITEGQIIMLKSSLGLLHGKTEIDSLAELDELGLTCGTGAGTTQQEELSAEAPGALKSYGDFDLALAAMKLGSIKCVYAETPVTTEWIATADPGTPLVVIYRRPYYPVAFVASKDADILVEKINIELAKMIGNGELDALKKKWRC